ncbi:spermidine synthase [Pseudoclavibacter chungangensis]|uniref:spermidine synthase n=1 Tax=Pseudoclavibacter chungangensis TaxID=587635 RepID=UPI0015C6C4A9|nr:fused MFS/spermidine synthase [Pseudoclavibacter chungangensis]NYJ65432.1 spermidine synthase [Pseudoclavibacter chungangensis]
MSDGSRGRGGSRRRRADDEITSTITLPSGATAAFVRDDDEFVLVVDGTPQSAVNPDDPTQLSFGYIRHMGHVIDLAYPEHEALTVLHLGGGALTLPRYIDATRPRSRQQVVELEPELMAFVRRTLPLDPSAAIRIRYGDAREQLGRLPAGIRGRVDIAIVDVFAGARTPAHVTSVEFFTEVRELLVPDGLVLVNIADGHELVFARGEVATLVEVFGEVTLIADPATLKGRRFGNITAVAGAHGVELPGIERRVASGFPPATVLPTRATREWLRGTPPVHDADATPSPLPGRQTFTQRRSGGW